MRLSVRLVLLLVVGVSLVGASGLTAPRAPAAAAQDFTVVLAPEADTFVALGVLTPAGTLESLRAGWRNGADYWTYLRFPIAENLPTGTTIVNATLKMWCKEPSLHQNPTGEASFLLKRVRTSWDEANLVYKDKPQAVEPSVKWAILRCAKPEWREVDVTTMVQKWYSGEFENLGFELGAERASPEHLYTFQSRENESPPPLGKQPQLWITYRGGVTPTVPPTETFTPTTTPTPTITPTVTDTPEPSETPTVTPTPEWTDTPTPTFTPEPPPGIYLPLVLNNGVVGQEPAPEPTVEGTVEPTAEATAEPTVQALRGLGGRGSPRRLANQRR